MKTVLLLVHDDAGQEARLQCALDIVRAVDGHLQCLDVSLMPPAVGCIADGLGEATLIEDERVRESGNTARLQQRLLHEDVPWSWADTAGDFAACLKNAAALVDLIVLNRKLDTFPYPDMLKTAAETLFAMGKPILAVPDDIRRFPSDGRALVAWDGSPKCAASLQAAVPLLQFAAEVILFEIDDGSTVTPAEDAAEYLSHRDIHARIVREVSCGNPIPTKLLAGVAKQHADYVVMGAYSHFRMTEALFGGVTRRMLQQSPVPLFLAH